MDILSMSTVYFKVTVCEETNSIETDLDPCFGELGQDAMVMSSMLESQRTIEDSFNHTYFYGAIKESAKELSYFLFKYSTINDDLIQLEHFTIAFILDDEEIESIYKPGYEWQNKFRSRIYRVIEKVLN